MTDWNGLQDSLALTGTLQLGLAFTALCCYALALGGIFSPNVRLFSAFASVASACGLAASIHPWTNGVILAAVGMAGMGVFTAAVWVLSAFCGLAGRRAPRSLPVTAAGPFTDAVPLNGGGPPRMRQPRHAPARPA